MLLKLRVALVLNRMSPPRQHKAKAGVCSQHDVHVRPNLGQSYSADVVEAREYIVEGSVGVAQNDSVGRRKRNREGQRKEHKEKSRAHNPYPREGRINLAHVHISNGASESPKRNSCQAPVTILIP
jgi:hypothetical protein